LLSISSTCEINHSKCCRSIKGSRSKSNSKSNGKAKATSGAAAAMSQTRRRVAFVVNTFLAFCLLIPLGVVHGSDDVG